MATVIESHGLTKRYGHTLALDALDLAVPGGVVFGYLGPNGAGKTTTIRLLAGLLRPTSGSCAVRGFDCVRQRDLAQRHIGYLPGDFTAHPDLTGAEYVTFLGHLRGDARPARTRELADRLGLDLTTRIGRLSHGNRQKIGIVQAFAHDPDVLILDEPTSGLDPLVQREFLDMLREARAGGRTVFLSSHVIAEVEAVADMVGMLRGGRLVVVQSVEVLKARALRRVELTLAEPVPLPVLCALPAVRQAEVEGHTAYLVVEGSMADLMRTTAPYGVCGIVTHEPDLEEIFLAYYDRKEAGTDAELGVPKEPARSA